VNLNTQTILESILAKEIAKRAEKARYNVLCCVVGSVFVSQYFYYYYYYLLLLINFYYVVLFDVPIH